MTRLVLLLSFFIVPTQYAAADPLTGAEMHKVLIGHTWAWTSKKFDTSGVSTYFRDGRMIVKVDGLGNRPERGHWLIKGDRICVTLIGNPESCSGNIVRVNANTLFSESTQTTFVRRE